MLFLELMRHAMETATSLGMTQAALLSGRSASTTENSLVPLATLGAAAIAAVVTLVSVFLQRRSARETAATLRKSAAAAKTSAKAAVDAVELNAVTSRTAGIRADNEALSKRYQDAATQLGHDKAAVRLAGVYAMARLADDWPEQRQTCVDVLCAYLRMPPSEKDGQLDEREEQVRQSVVTVLRTHLQDPHAETSWSGIRLDLSGARFYRLNLDGAVFVAPPNFRFLTVDWECSFKEVKFLNGGDLSIPIIQPHSTVRLTAFSVDNGTLRLSGPEVGSKGKLIVHPAAVGKTAKIYIDFGRVSGSLSIMLSNQAEPSGEISVSDTQIFSGGELSVSGLESLFAGKTENAPRVNVSRCKVEREGHVDISGQLIANGLVYWAQSIINEGADVDLTNDEIPNFFEVRPPNSDSGEDTSNLN